MAEAKVDQVIDLSDDSTLIELSVIDGLRHEITIHVYVMADGSIRAEKGFDSDDVPLSKEEQEHLDYLLSKDD
jgi:hypothetical protein